MKIYTVEYDANRPSLKQVNIPNYSNAKIGIEVISNNEKIELTKDNVKLTSGGTTLSADGEYNGYVTVPVSVGDCGSDTMYKVDIHKETTLIDTDIKLVTPSDTPTGTVISVEYSLSDMVGQELNADSVQVIQRYNDNIEFINFLNIIDNNGRVVKAWQSPKTQGTPAPEPVWSDYRTTTGRVKSIKIEDGWKLFSSCAASTLSKGKTREIKIKQTSTFNNSFKLVINSVKSSVCDVTEDIKIPVATTETIGGVKIGSGINVDSEGKISVASGNTPMVFQAFKGSEVYLKNNTVDVTGVKVGDIILAGSAENAIKVMWCGPEFNNNTIYIDNIDTNNMTIGVYSGVVMSIVDTPSNTQIVVACGEKCVRFSGNKGE